MEEPNKVNTKQSPGKQLLRLVDDLTQLVEQALRSLQNLQKVSRATIHRLDSLDHRLDLMEKRLNHIEQRLDPMLSVYEKEGE